VFLLDPDDPGETEVWDLGDGSPTGSSRFPGGVMGAKPPETWVWGEAPEAEQVLMIIKTFLAEILLIKSCIYNIIRSPTMC